VGAEPTSKRAVVFVDGQNLFHAVRAAFGYSHPNYDVLALGRAICATKGWASVETRFGVMGREGIHVVSRPLRYRNQTVRLPDDTEHTVLVAEEKGIDVRTTSP
jgi:hypothetical protein